MRSIERFNPDNPLAKYKEESKKEWAEIAKLTDTSMAYLIEISQMTQDKIAKVSLGKYLALKRELGVDLLQTKKF